jgi:hypothetical protein
MRAGFRKFSKQISCIARARRGRAGLAVYPSQLALCHDEVRFLIFDDPAEQCERQRPSSGSWEGKLPNPRGRAARARCMKFVSKIYEIPRAYAARA